MHFQSSSSADGSGGSIVGDLLDYLNESWTQFHATGTIAFLCIFVLNSLASFFVVSDEFILCFLSENLIRKFSNYVFEN